MINSITDKIRTNWSNPQKREKYTRCGFIGVAGLIGASTQVKPGLNEYRCRMKQVEKQHQIFRDSIEARDIFELRQDIQTNVCDKGVRISKGEPTACPNFVMFISNSKQYAERVIDWLMGKSNACFQKIDVNDKDLLEVLEQNEKKHDPLCWDFVYAKNMDDLLDRSKSGNDIIESMKDLMSCSAEDYHTTVLFITDKPEKLDEIALQPHRVTAQYDLRKINESDFFQFQISDREYKKYNRLKDCLAKDKFGIFAKPMTLGAIAGGIVGAASFFIYRSIKNANNKNNK